MTRLTLLFLVAALAACDSATPVTPGDPSGGTPPPGGTTTPPPGGTTPPPTGGSVTPQSSAPTSVTRSMLLVSCPIRSHSDVQILQSGTAATADGGFLVYESVPCRSRRIHEFDAAGTLLRTDSTDIPLAVYPASDGFYYFTREGGQDQLMRRTSGGQEQVAGPPGVAGSPFSLAEGLLLVGASRWTRLSSTGQIAWTATPPGGFLWRGFEAARDGGLFAVGCARSIATEYCSTRPGDHKIVARIGPDGAVRWVTTTQWDGEAVATLLGIRELPDGGAIAIGNVGNTSNWNRTLAAVRVDAAGNVVWDRTFDGWGEQNENLASLVHMQVVGDFIDATFMRFSSRDLGYRFGGVVMTTAGTVERRVLGTTAAVRSARLQNQTRAQSTLGGYSCFSTSCQGLAKLQVTIVR